MAATEYVRCNLCSTDDTEVLYLKDGFSISRCHQCGLVYVNPRPTRGQLQEIYGEEGYFANDPHLAAYTKSEPGGIQLQVIREVLRELASLSSKGRLLDVGCATGSFLGLAQREGWQVTGVEVSPFAANYARERLKAEIFEGELRKAEYPDSTFDVVHMWNVIEHLPDPKGDLLEAYRVMKEGGILVVCTLNFNGMSRLLLGKDMQEICPNQHIYYFTPKTFSNMLKASGFEVLKLQTKLVYLKNIVQLASKIAFRSSKRGDVDERYRRAYARVDGSRSLLLLNKVANIVLNATGKGDNLIAYARKR